MRVDVKAQACKINYHKQTVPSHRAKVTDHKVSPYADVTEVEHNSPHPPTTEPAPPLKSSSQIGQPPPLLSSSPRGPARDPDYLSFQKQHSSLVLQLSGLKQLLDTAEQALKIQSSNPDAELETLIQKWRLVSREAAEALFAGAKDRVNRMGGVGAWQERNQKQAHGWDEGEQINQDDLTDEQKDLIEEQKEEMEAEKRKYGMGKVEEVVEEKDDEVGPAKFKFKCSRLMTIANIVFHYGYDAQESQCGTGAHRIRQAEPEMDILIVRAENVKVDFRPRFLFVRTVLLRLAFCLDLWSLWHLLPPFQPMQALPAGAKLSNA
jgi:Swi5-dependent recombination DNA repair protein 1